MMSYGYRPHANSFIYAYTYNYSDLEIYAESDIESSAEMGYYWEGTGQPAGGNVCYYYSLYCGSPYGVGATPNHTAVAINTYGGDPAEVNLEISSEILGLPTDCTPCYISTGSTLDVSSDNYNYYHPPYYSYYGIYLNPYLSFDDQTDLWYLGWAWQVDMGEQGEDPIFYELDEGENVVSLNLSVSSYTYAYSNLDDYQEIFGHNNYFMEGWGWLYFSPS